MTKRDLEMIKWQSILRQYIWRNRNMIKLIHEIKSNYYAGKEVVKLMILSSLIGMLVTFGTLYILG